MRAAAAWLISQGVRARDADSRVDPDFWVPIPGLESSVTNRLRGCPKCWAEGHHSLAQQSDAIDRCPLHGGSLTQQCPGCGVHLFGFCAPARTRRFGCPRGCDLARARFVGLGGRHNEAMVSAYRRQRDWVGTVRRELQVVSQVAHIPYPGYQAPQPLVGQARPSPGLLAAVLERAREQGISLPSPLAWHGKPGAHWSIDVSPWRPTGCDIGGERVEHARRSFQRGAYETFVPLPDLARFRAWYDRFPNASHYLDTAALSLISGDVIAIRMRSYLLTNAEVHALRAVLRRDLAPEVAVGHYNDLLFDLLGWAIVRRQLLAGRRHDLQALDVSERVDAIVMHRGDLFRVCAYSEQLGARAAWSQFHEPAESGGGIDYEAGGGWR